jgi:hypothetical protein
VAIEAGAPPLASERRDLPRRLLAAVDGALARDPARRPRASALAAELRNALRRPQRREKPETRGRQAVDDRPALLLAERVIPAALAMIATGLGAALLPFWPSALVVTLVAGAGLGALVHPRIGLAVALAAPVFPLGNLAEGAAVLYSALALAWLGLAWRHPRTGLLFVLGPVFAPLGLLALVPLAVQPAKGVLRRGSQALVAVLAAALVAGTAGDDLPLAASPASSLGIAPPDSVRDVAGAISAELALHPLLLGGALVAAVAAAGLPWAARTRYGVAAVGGALVVASVATGTGAFGLLAAGLVWAAAAGVAPRTGR